jgi:ABC-2 type transport system ATP-binding protein
VEIITRYRERGGTILLTTHYMEEAERLCDRIAIVDHGKRIALGTPKELIATLEAPNIIEVTTEPLLQEADFRAVPGFHGATRHGGGWSLRVDALASAVPQLLAAIDAKGAKLEVLSTHAATLEDLFVAMTGRELRDA